MVDAPEGVKSAGCKWVFKEKTDMDGNVNVFKARTVAKGFPFPLLQCPRPLGSSLPMRYGKWMSKQLGRLPEDVCDTT